MISLKIGRTTFSVLISGLYCGFHGVDPMAIPESVWMEIVEKLESYLDKWDYDVCSLEQFFQNNLIIYPRTMLDDATVKDMKENTLYWERVNGNVILSISMDMNHILKGDDV